MAISAGECVEKVSTAEALRAELPTEVYVWVNAYKPQLGDSTDDDLRRFEAIAGGALVIVQGWLADKYGLQTSFLLTAACELYVLFYAVWGSKPVVSGGEPATESRQIG